MIGFVLWDEDGEPCSATLHDDLSWDVPEDPDRGPILALRYRDSSGDPPAMCRVLGRSWLRQLAAETHGRAVYIDSPALAATEED